MMALTHEEERERAVVAFSNGDMQVARRLLPKVCRRSPDDVLALAYLAVCLHEREGRSRRVQKMLERAKRGPGEVGIAFQADGVLLVKEGHLHAGIEMLRKGVALDARLRNRWVLATHLELLATVEADEEAIALYEGCLAEAPDCEDAYFRLSTLLLRQQRVAEATKLLTSAVRWVPDSADIQYNLAVCYEEAANLDWAVFHMEQAVAGNCAMLVEAHFALAEMKLELGDRRAARRHALACLAIDPTHEAARALIKTLDE